MKYFLLILSCCFLSCERTQVESITKEKITVLSTIAMIDDIVGEIGKDHIHHDSLIKGELDPHTYELVKGDDEKFATADLIFYNGLGLEHGYSLRNNLETNGNAISLGDSIREREPSKILEIEGAFDPHIWMDVALWKEIIDPIVDNLVKKDPSHAEEYRSNGAALKLRMEEVDAKIYERLQNIDSEKRYLVTSHNAFNYFVRHYLLDANESSWQLRLAAPEGLAPESELSLHDIKRVLSYIEKHQIKVLFAESNVNKDALKKIISAAKEKGMNLRLANEALYADAMGQENSYLDMISHNVSIIASELEKEYGER